MEAKLYKLVNPLGYALAVVCMNEHELQWAKELLKTAATNLHWELI